MSSNLRRQAVAVFAALLIGAPESYSEPFQTSPTRLQACIASQAQEQDFSGIITVAWKDGSLSHVRGQVSSGTSPPIKVGSQFNMGSAGKMFTAVAIGELLDSGKITLDEPIGKYVTGLTPQTSRVTVKQLLNHSSGLGNYFAPENLPTLMKAKTLDDLKPLVSKETPAFEPGTRFSYSDSGFLILGLLIQRVSGQSYGDYIRDHIFALAQMRDTILTPAVVPVRAQGMTRMPSPLAMLSRGAPPTGINTGQQPQEPPVGPRMLLRPGEGMPQGPMRPAEEATLLGSPAGGAYSTAGDMANFFAALLRGDLIRQDTLKLMTSPQGVAEQPAAGSSRRGYGLGFGVGEFQGHHWFGHNGGAPGVNVETFVFPDDQLTLVVLSNRDPPAASPLFQKVRAAIFEKAVLDSCTH